MIITEEDLAWVPGQGWVIKETGPTPPPKKPATSTRCHLAALEVTGNTHMACDGQAYGPALTDPSVACTCPCHPQEPTA